MTRWFATYGPTYVHALGWTAAVAVLAALGAVAWGCVLLLVRLAGGRWGAPCVDAYVQAFRNTPVLLPIYLIYFGFPLVGLPWPAVVCGGLALILQNGAYVSEILRGSFKAIDHVQFDAAKSIGLSPWHTFRKVTLPQVLVYSIPSLGNQVVLLLKDTSLLSAITVTELTMQAKLLTEQTGAAYEAFLVVAALYLVLVTSTEVVFRTAHRAVRWR
ncbi:MAG TPA: amino acid ABC transporter permease [Solirubrobacterales bacterium]|jgi:polar amino acid transport system permease protein|nr:amino acid ABC transporter permease [Solirubrobacterales bacterium]